MQISKKSDSEQIKVENFTITEDGVRLDELIVNVPFKTSQFAIAAMLKGLEEYFYKPAELKGSDEEVTKKIDHNLEAWKEINAKAKSPLIL